MDSQGPGDEQSGGATAEEASSPTKDASDKKAKGKLKAPGDASGKPRERSKSREPGEKKPKSKDAEGGNEKPKSKAARPPGSPRPKSKDSKDPKSMGKSTPSQGKAKPDTEPDDASPDGKADRASMESDESGAMASINCKCGAVKFGFKTRQPLCRFDCCCYDCSSALRYANKLRGGPSGPEHQLVDSMYFPNDFTILRGKDKIGAFKNFDTGITTRFFCADCWSLLLQYIDQYQGKILMTLVGCYGDFEGLQNVDKIDSISRHFVKDLSEDQKANILPFRGDPSKVYESIPPPAVLRRYLDAGATGKDMNVQILLSIIGEPFIPDDDPLLTVGKRMREQQKVLQVQRETGVVGTSQEAVPLIQPVIDSARKRAEGASNAGKSERPRSATESARRRAQGDGDSGKSVRPRSATDSAGRGAEAGSAASARPRSATAATAYGRGVPRSSGKMQPKSKEALADEKAGLSMAYMQIGSAKGAGQKSEIRSKDVEQLVKLAGGRVGKEVLEEFMKVELGCGDNGSVNEADFTKNATAYFDKCVPSEECTEMWQLIGGRLTGESTVQASDLYDAMAKVGCRLSKTEVEDLVAFASYGNDKMAYEDFVRALFP